MINNKELKKSFETKEINIWHKGDLNKLEICPDFNATDYILSIQFGYNFDTLQSLNPHMVYQIGNKKDDIYSISYETASKLNAVKLFGFEDLDEFQIVKLINELELLGDIRVFKGKSAHHFRTSSACITKFYKEGKVSYKLTGINGCSPNKSFKSIAEIAEKVHEISKNSEYEQHYKNNLES